jgi:pyruvate,water dikinase
VSRDARNLIEWLGRAGGEAEALGGKGASLDRLAKLGFRVPPGFCLTTAAFRAQLEAIREGAPASVLEPSGTAHLAAALASQRISPIVDEALAEATGALVEQLAGLSDAEPRFAVRSSAVGEDGAAASYAGLHETELDVAPGMVPSAVRRCWASLWSPVATAYRQRRGLSDHDAEIAVVVQALVPADAAAVVFTRHPVTHREDQLVITAVRGLGEAMVAGTVTPDTWVVDRPSRSVLTFEPGDGGRGEALDAESLGDLVGVSLEIEARFQRHVDVEAAIARGTWYVLQARPITTGASATATGATGPAGATGQTTSAPGVTSPA